MVVLFIASIAAIAQPPKYIATKPPTATMAPTPPPTATMVPTNTPKPTATMVPTRTPRPTATTKPTPTPQVVHVTYKNCTELRKYYPDGVPSTHPAYRPKFDRDKDGWGCE